ncbi:hypothetical protein B5M42_001385 [Paenibacillus athensensis]|uniref:Uncharacterized protein n=1 Tax=Paenibacillus athensensis TaxID=1967502 RepID=A0A4Y8QCL0_9BACL|nr:hypothetical protein [Paenibacillus athensensis]MCD1257490.1 hypothetical protein [Paenibacillus athensensis]
MSEEAVSFKQQRKIAWETLQQRIASVKELADGELERYEVSKDTATGEHFLHYSYLHRDLSAGGEPEVFHQLLPLETDDVLGLVFGEQPYTYPQHWREPFLRNGPEGFYIWFDPSGELEAERDQAIARELMDKLRQFREAGSLNAEEVGKLMDELDRMRRNEP